MIHVRLALVTRRDSDCQHPTQLSLSLWQKEMNVSTPSNNRKADTHPTRINASALLYLHIMIWIPLVINKGKMILAEVIGLTLSEFVPARLITFLVF
jgi:hypothetical protein